MSHDGTCQEQAASYRLLAAGFRIQDHRSGNGAKSGTGTVVGTEDGAWGKLEKSQGAKKMEMLKKGPDESIQSKNEHCNTLTN